MHQKHGYKSFFSEIRLHFGYTFGYTLVTADNQQDMI